MIGEQADEFRKAEHVVERPLQVFRRASRAAFIDPRQGQPTDDGIVSRPLSFLQFDEVWNTNRMEFSPGSIEGSRRRVGLLKALHPRGKSHDIEEDFSARIFR